MKTDYLEIASGAVLTALVLAGVCAMWIRTQRLDSYLASLSDEQWKEITRSYEASN